MPLSQSFRHGASAFFVCQCWGLLGVGVGCSHGLYNTKHFAGGALGAGSVCSLRLVPLDSALLWTAVPCVGDAGFSWGFLSCSSNVQTRR
jgi:hypothetical protein